MDILLIIAKKKIYENAGKRHGEIGNYRYGCKGCLDNLPKDFETDRASRKRILKTCPLLSNPEFLESYPDAIRVAEILHATAEIHTRTFMGFDLFDKLEVEDVNGFLHKLEQKYAAAIKLYEHIRDDLSIVYDNYKRACGASHNPGFYVRHVNRYPRSARRGFKDYHTKEE